MEHLGVDQSEVDKMDVLETLPQLKRFTLPDSGGKRSQCPVSNRDICNEACGVSPCQPQPFPPAPPPPP